MLKRLPVIFLVFLILFALFNLIKSKNDKVTGAPPYLSEDLEPPEDQYAFLRNWKRPNGPPKVGLQVGHWKSQEVPDELKRLKENTGSSGGGMWEWEVNLKIAELTAEILKAKGVQVEILPATIPPEFWADVFVAIHADGSTDLEKSGFKAAHPRRDYTQKADQLLSLVESEYQTSTGLTKDPNVTRNMRGYYAFAWWRYDHAVHPMTTSLILETGFLTSASDRKIIVQNPKASAQGLANGIIKYLESQNLLSSK